MAETGDRRCHGAQRTKGVLTQQKTAQAPVVTDDGGAATEATTSKGPAICTAPPPYSMHEPAQPLLR